MMNSLSELVANSIVKYGMEQTSTFSYLVCLNDFIENMDNESKKYILNHKNEIINKVQENDNIASVDYDADRDEFDMVFYFGGLMDNLENQVYDRANELGVDLELEDVYEISFNILNSDFLDEKIVQNIESLKKDAYEI